MIDIYGKNFKPDNSKSQFLQRYNLCLMTSLLFLFIFFFACKPLYAIITFERTYGGINSDYGYSVQQTLDGGYIIVGSTYSFGAGGSDVYLIKTDSLGDTLWTKTYGGSEDDGGRWIYGTNDGGYVVVGYIGLFVGYNIYLLKLNNLGDTLWTKTYDLGINNFGYAVLQTYDHGYILTGNNDGNLFIVRTDSMGNPLWTKSYGGASDDCGSSIIETQDHEYLITGDTQSFGAGGMDVWLLRVNSYGDTLLTRTYGGTTADAGKLILPAYNQGYMIVGQTNSFGAGAMDAYLVRIDTLYDTLWARAYGGTNWDFGESVFQTSANNYVIFGATRSYGAGNYDVWILKVSSTTGIIWSKMYGGSSFDYGQNGSGTNDGGYITVGYTYSFGAGGYDIYLIKTDTLGCVSISEKQAPNKVNSKYSIFVSPNPFKTTAEIYYNTSDLGETPTSLKIYNSSGRLVKSYLIYYNTANKIFWTGYDNNNNPCPSGIYFIEIDRKISQKAIKVR